MLSVIGAFLSFILFFLLDNTSLLSLHKEKVLKFRAINNILIATLNLKQRENGGIDYPFHGFYTCGKWSATAEKQRESQFFFFQLKWKQITIIIITKNSPTLKFEISGLNKIQTYTFKLVNNFLALSTYQVLSQNYSCDWWWCCCYLIIPWCTLTIYS